MSKTESIYDRIAGLETWLTEQGVDVKQEQSHLQEGSRERLYWHYGYLVGLRDAMKAVSQ